MKISLTKMLPFLNAEDLTTLTEKIIQTDDCVYSGVTLSAVLPFLPDEKVDELFFRELEKKEDVSMFYPYLSDQACQIIVDQFMEGTLELDINELYPFLPDEELHRLFAHILEKEET